MRDKKTCEQFGFNWVEPHGLTSGYCYTTYEEYVSYKIDSKDVVINCFYIKQKEDSNE